MKIEFVTKGYTLHDDLKTLIEDKMKKFGRYFNDDATAKVSLKSIGKDKYGMEITIFFGSNMVRSEVVSDRMNKNIDLALPKIEGQIRKYRTQLANLKKATLEEEALYPTASAPKDQQLVRTKTIHLNPITTELAIEKMALADHDFYVYKDEATGMVSIVYCREDGDVGRIELVY